VRYDRIMSHLLDDLAPPTPHLEDLIAEIERKTRALLELRHGGVRVGVED
jgi:hypothetical protein